MTGPPGNIHAVGSRYLEPSRGIEKCSSYWEFELSGFENKGPKTKAKRFYHILLSCLYSYSVHCNQIFFSLPVIFYTFNLVLRVSHLTAPANGKMRDPGIEVVYHFTIFERTEKTLYSKLSSRCTGRQLSKALQGKALPVIFSALQLKLQRHEFSRKQN